MDIRGYFTKKVPLCGVSQVAKESETTKKSKQKETNLAPINTNSQKFDDNMEKPISTHPISLCKSTMHAKPMPLGPILPTSYTIDVASDQKGSSNEIVESISVSPTRASTASTRRRSTRQSPAKALAASPKKSTVLSTSTQNISSMADAEEASKHRNLDTEATPTKSNTISKYEEARLANIRANQERLQQLGLFQPVSAISEHAPEPTEINAKKKTKKRTTPKPAIPPERRSKRSRGEKPDYTGEKIDKFGDELDAMVARAPRREMLVKQAEKSVDEVLGKARDLMLQSRKNMAERINRGDATQNSKGNSADVWFTRAVTIWGARVADAQPPSWELYVSSRMATPPPPSPYMLLQEVYAPDTWRLLICCVLMSRVASHETKHRCISGFFDRFPTPSAAIEADPKDVLDIIAPLGLFDNRIRAVIAVTERFLTMDAFDCGMEKEVKIYGIGEFGVDSYRIFCRNEGCDMTPADRNLRAFTSWLKDSQANTQRSITDASSAHGIVVKTEPT